MPKVNNKKPSKRRSNQQQQQQQETIQHPCLVFKNKREKVKYLLNELALLYHKNSDIVIDECEIHFIEVIKELKTHLDIYSLLQQKIDAWQKDVDFIHKFIQCIIMIVYMCEITGPVDKTKTAKLHVNKDTRI